MNPFERAARVKLRFVSPVGQLTVENLFDTPQLTVENLFDTPLTSDKSELSLDSLAKGIARQLREETVESFVESPAVSRHRTDLELKLEILKHVIAVRIAQRDARAQAAANAVRREKLVQALAAKEESTLVGMTKEEIEAEIDKLSRPEISVSA